MQHRIVSRAVRISAAAAVAATLALGSTASTRFATRGAVDPVGHYDWSLVMVSMDNTPIAGTLTVARQDSALSASITSDHTDGELAASSVKLDGDRLTVVSNGDFGEFTMHIDFKGDSLDGTFHFVGQDGSGADGPLSISRTPK